MQGSGLERYCSSYMECGSCIYIHNYYEAALKYQNRLHKYNKNNVCVSEKAALMHNNIMVIVCSSEGVKFGISLAQAI